MGIYCCHIHVNGSSFGFVLSKIQKHGLMSFLTKRFESTCITCFSMCQCKHIQDQPIAPSSHWGKLRLNWPCGSTSGFVVLLLLSPHCLRPSLPFPHKTFSWACARSMPPVSPTLFTQVRVHSLQWWTPVQTLTLCCLSGKCQNKSCHN